MDAHAPTPSAPSAAPRRLLDLSEEARPHRPALPDIAHLYAAARPTWSGRMINEHGSAAVFEGLAAQLRDLGAPDADVAACAAFAGEERLHGVLCAAVVEALGGEARALVDEPAPLPRHLDVAPAEAALRNILSICCLAETVAVSIIGAERLEMPDGPLRDLLGRILADEVGHARFGWRYLDRVAKDLDEGARARLGDYLAVAFAHLERHELDHLHAGGRVPPGGAALGLCDGGEARELFYDTVRAVIIPRLEAHGLPAAAAWDRRPRARA